MSRHMNQVVACNHELTNEHHGFLTTSGTGALLDDPVVANQTADAHHISSAHHQQWAKHSDALLKTRHRYCNPFFDTSLTNWPSNTPDRCNHATIKACEYRSRFPVQLGECLTCGHYRTGKPLLPPTRRPASTGQRGAPTSSEAFVSPPSRI